MMHTDSPLVVIFGATASGKSALALSVASARPSVIINADAMQCYAGLSILTAQPTAEEQHQQPHALYGMWQPEFFGNAQAWVAEAVQAIEAAWHTQKLPIVVGGTGLYLRALLEGFHTMPDIAPEIRAKVRAMPQAMRYQQLQTLDSRGAALLNEGDSQRVSRALEVVLASGDPVHVWHAKPKTLPLPQAAVHSFVLDRPREALYARIDARFDAMMQNGAVEEAQRFLAAHGNGDTPIFKACGLPELAAALDGAISIEEAVHKAKQYSRNYAKRQLTWARQQCGSWARVDADSHDSIVQKLSS